MQKAHFDNKIMGFGIEAKRDVQGWFGIKGSLFAEIAWEYVPGRHHDIYPWKTNPSAVVTWNGDPLDPAWSFDNRKEYGQGLNLRLGYAAPMPSFGGGAAAEFFSDMEWFAGLSIDRYKVRSEVKWTFDLGARVVDPWWYDGGARVEEGGQFVPGVFAGLRYKLRNDVGFELTLRNFGRWRYEFTPAIYGLKGRYIDDEDLVSVFGTGKSKTGTTRGTSIEFAITLKL
jgi:hypothetical protein